MNITQEILCLITISVIIIYNIIKNKETEKNTIIKNKNDKFKSKIKLMTNTEYKFYKLINNIAQKYNLIVFTQVALNQIIKAQTYKELKQIGGKSIDFVLTDKFTNIKLCIELDDYTHNKDKRQTRDNIVNNIFNKTDIKLLRIPIDQAFIYERIEKQIKESL